MNRTIGELSSASTSCQTIGDPSTIVTDIQYDSRLVEPGTLFAALRGGYVDGHSFVEQAVERGATALLVERRQPVAVPQLVVPDARAALSPVSARFFGFPSAHLSVVGITGTDGKTTTSYLTDSIMAAAGRVTGLIGTVSVKIGDRVVQHETRQTTPESVEIQRILREMVDSAVEWAILEATSHGLAQHRLDDVAFDIAAVTNITHEHLEFHKTIPAYRAAKASLFDRVSSSSGSAVVNLDDEGARSVLPHCRGVDRLLTYSLVDPAADLFATDIAFDSRGTTFSLSMQGRTADMRSPLVGQFNVENALCAIGICLLAGLDLERIGAGLSNASPIPGRMERVDAGQPFQVIVDYAHTPESLQKLLMLLRMTNQDGRIIAVSGSAGERDVAKRSLQGSVSQRFADFSIFTTEDPRFEDPAAIIEEIARGAIAAGGRQGATFLTIVDRTEAIRAAIDRALPGDIVVLAGKGHERSIIWGAEKRPWNEAEVARTILRDRGYVRDS